MVAARLIVAHLGKQLVFVKRLTVLLPPSLLRILLGCLGIARDRVQEKYREFMGEGSGNMEGSGEASRRKKEGSGGRVQERGFMRKGAPASTSPPPPQLPGNGYIEGSGERVLERGFRRKGSRERVQERGLGMPFPGNREGSGMPFPGNSEGSGETARLQKKQKGFRNGFGFDLRGPPSNEYGTYKTESQGNNQA